MNGSILIANRGAIAVRAIHTFRSLGLRSIAVYSEADAGSPHVDLADEAHLLGSGEGAEVYQHGDELLEIALKAGANAVFPGWGLLSEDPGFASEVECEGMKWLGPAPGQIAQFGLKHEARRLARLAGVPLVPGSGLLESKNATIAAAEELGFPVMLKTTAGAGGAGMALCRSRSELERKYDGVVRMGQSFGNGAVFIERYLERGRRIEIPIFGDGRGKVLALGEVDASMQHHHRQAIAETPAMNLPERTRVALNAAAVLLGESIEFRSAGNVEFLYDDDHGNFHFIGVNPSLPISHGIIEIVSGIDVIEWMARLALDPAWCLPEETPARDGCAIQANIEIGHPVRDGQTTGHVVSVSFPENLRCDHWMTKELEITPQSDPLLAALMVHAADRKAAVEGLREALDDTTLVGIETNLDWLQRLVRWTPYQAGGVTPREMAEFE